MYFIGNKSNCWVVGILNKRNKHIHKADPMCFV